MPFPTGIRGEGGGEGGGAGAGAGAGAPTSVRAGSEGGAAGAASAGGGAGAGSVAGGDCDVVVSTGAVLGTVGSGDGLTAAAFWARAAPAFSSALTIPEAMAALTRRSTGTSRAGLRSR